MSKIRQEELHLEVKYLANEILAKNSSLLSHDFAKRPSRTVYGRVDVTYMNPLQVSGTQFDPPISAYNSRPDQVNNLIIEPSYKTFMLFDNDLSGDFKLVDENSEVGWWIPQFADSTGTYTPPFVMHFTYIIRFIDKFNIYCDPIRGVYPIDFDVTFYDYDGTVTVINIRNNDLLIIPIEVGLSNVQSMDITIYNISQPNTTLIITEILIASQVTYENDNLMSIDLLEELQYEREIEVLGGLSSNMVTVYFDNTDQAFFFNNTVSIVAEHLHKNRKIVPWLGYYYEELDTIEWHRLGTFWSYSWEVPQDDLYVKVVALDTLGLLKTMEFYDHEMFIDTSLYDIFEYIFEDAKKTLPELQYTINVALKGIIIPYVWFDRENYFSAMNKLSQVYNMFIYCDHEGAVIVDIDTIPETFEDEWERTTNIFEATYPTQYTTSPNSFTVGTVSVSEVANVTLLDVTQSQDVLAEQSLYFTFSSPAANISDLQVTVSATGTYTMDLYSWGVIFAFATDGTLDTLTINGTSIEITSGVTLTAKDNTGIAQDGVKSISVESNFIQNIDHAQLIMTVLRTSASIVKYNAQVSYRGDASLIITDPIILPDSIAPDPYYIIKKHSLYWSGALSGEADLFTTLKAVIVDEEEEEE